VESSPSETEAEEASAKATPENAGATA